MKSTGIIRFLDGRNRIRLPAEITERIGIEKGCLVEFYKEGDGVSLKRHESSCIFCNETYPEMYEFCGRVICPYCIETIKGVRNTK